MVYPYTTVVLSETDDGELQAQPTREGFSHDRYQEYRPNRSAVRWPLRRTNMVWSYDCPEGVRARNATNPDVAQAQPSFVSGMYKLFHEAHLNDLDDLGDYVQNFQMDQPPRR